jgi:hypothetical protein
MDDKTKPAPATPTSGDASRPVKYRPWWNWLTVLGVIFAGVAFLVSVILVVVGMLQPDATIYLSLLSLGVMPMFIVGGLGVAVLGFVIQVLYMRWRGTQSGLWFDPVRHQRLLPVWLLVIGLFLIASSYGSYKSYHFIESKEFCGEVCHSVMHPEFMAHSNSPHSRVACIECHAGPGIEHQVRAKLRGVHQVVAIATGEFNRPLPTPLQHLRPAKDICGQCHWPEKFIGNTVQDHVYFLPDEENTQHHLKLLMHVGGGTEDIENKLDRQPSIHWHVTSSNKVSYVASDAQRQQIQVVNVTDPTGKVTTYRNTDMDEETAEEIKHGTVREMDCIECHNRAVHVFKPPQRLLNQALLAGTIDVTLPYIKRQGLQVMGKTYETGEQAKAAITKDLLAFYETEYPELYQTRKPAIEQAARTMVALYGQNLFPEMKADWRAHPDNIGHMFSQGCFRCHSEKMQNDEGVSISFRCETCHDFVAQGTGKVAPKLLSQQEFIHPEDIDDMWKESACTDCHTGAGTDL